MLSRSDLLALELQRRLAQAAMPAVALALFVWLRWVRGYRFGGSSQEARVQLSLLRRQYRAIRAEARGPLVICVNHLTLVDSLIAIWALAPAWRYVVRPREFPWNLPERRNFFERGLLLKIGCILVKCLPVRRGGSPEEERRLHARIPLLLRKGESLMIFPEGGRSRGGRVDPGAVSYAVGSLLQRVPEAAVLCLYLRGEGQETYGDLPKQREKFRARLRLIRPSTELEGLRGARELSRQVARGLEALEREHFSDATRAG